MKPNGSIGVCKEYFGYDFDDFKNHIKSSLLELNFYARKEKWEIDHYFPIWAFVESGVFDLKLINSLDNILAIRREDNRKKAYKLNAIEFVRWLELKGAILES